MFKILSLLALAATPAVNAHYIFNILIVNGQQIGGEYDYFRRNSNTYMPSYPNELFDSTDLRCNKGAVAGDGAGTYEVNAGDEIGFKLFYNEFIEHPGPGFVYMSKAPGSVDEYDGSGDWFKVYEEGLCSGSPNNDASWCGWQKDRITFTIPENLPPGEYLTRVEHIGLHQAFEGKAQHYMECAQLKVNGPGGGTPAPLVKIPGIYAENDPGIRFDKWSGQSTTYEMPGPAVWDGA